ncbi:hypothetical protein BDQ17DRAFT_1329743 [Cyathus striatus]|nr:hypothetical protein BDQ17DRAFT_1329743 [Cyathus striatus]
MILLKGEQILSAEGKIILDHPYVLANHDINFAMWKEFVSFMELFTKKPPTQYYHWECCITHPRHTGIASDTSTYNAITPYKRRLGEIVVALEHLKIVNVGSTTSYLHVSSFFLFLYEYFITLDLEVKYIWNSPWTLIKTLFLVTRYLTFIDTSLDIIRHFSPHLSAEACYRTFSTVTWMGIAEGKPMNDIRFTYLGSMGKKEMVDVFPPTYYVLSWNEIHSQQSRHCSKRMSIDGRRQHPNCNRMGLLLAYDIAYGAFKQDGMSRFSKAVYSNGFSLANLLTAWHESSALV